MSILSEQTGIAAWIKSGMCERFHHHLQSRLYRIHFIYSIHPINLLVQRQLVEFKSIELQKISKSVVFWVSNFVIFVSDTKEKPCPEFQTTKSWAISEENWFKQTIENQRPILFTKWRPLFIWWHCVCCAWRGYRGMIRECVDSAKSMWIKF